MSYRITIMSDSVEPLTTDVEHDRQFERTWISEVVPPAADAPPEEWAEFSDRLAWATRSIAKP